MKKFISILVSFMVLQTTVFASAADGLMTALEKSQTLKSASTHMVFETELNRPLDILDTIPTDEDEYINVNPRMIAESLAESTMIMDCSYSASDDYKKMSLAASMEFDVPVSFNEDFKLNAWTKIGMWVEYDITDAENPVCKMIYKIPFMKKYMVLDMSEYYRDNSDMMPAFDGESIKELSRNAMEALKNNAAVSKTNGGYMIKLSDEGAKNYYLECMKLAKDFLPAESDAYDEFDTVVSDIQYFMDNVTVFGKDGITMTVSVNPNGFITAEAVDVHICMNVYDILTLYSKNTNGLDREKAFIDITSSLSAEIKNHNKTEVEMPVITEDNSQIEEYYDYYSSHYNKSEEPPVLKNDMVYYPIETLAAQCDMTVETGDNTITVTDGDNIVTIEGNKINGEEVITEVPLLITENDKIYCLEEALYPIGIYIENVGYDLDKKQLWISFSYAAVELYEEEITFEEVTEEAEPEEYIPDEIYYYFYLDRLPFEKNGAVYMPVYEFVQELYVGEFEFGSDYVTYSGDGENVFGIHTITAKTGEWFVTVNGEARPLDAPVESKDGVIYIPVTFAYSLGLEGGVSARYREGDGSSSTYNFNWKNPEYEDEDEYVYEPSYYYIRTDRLPHMIDDTIYIPIYDLLLEIFDGEFEFAETGFTYTADGKNAFDIESVSVYSGDKFVTVDGEKIELTSEAIMVDGVLRVPMSFVEDMGLEVDGIYISRYNSGTSYSLVRKDNAEDLNWFETLF